MDSYSLTSNIKNCKNLMTSLFLDLCDIRSINILKKCISVVNGQSFMKFCTWVAHGKPVEHTKQNCEISTYVILKFERFIENT